MERDINLQVVHAGIHRHVNWIWKAKKINIDLDEAVHNELLQLEQHCLR